MWLPSLGILNTIGGGGHAHLWHFVCRRPGLRLCGWPLTIRHLGVLNFVDTSLRAHPALRWVELDAMLRGRSASGGGVGTMVVSAIILPSTDGLGGIDWVLLPVFDASLFVEERRSCPVPIWRCSIGLIGGHGGELFGRDEREDL